MAVAAIFDERRLKRRFDPRHLGEIDVPAKLSPVSGFEVEFLDLLAAHHHDPGLFRVGGIDKHLVCHDELSTWRSPTALLSPSPDEGSRRDHVAAPGGGGANALEAVVDRRRAPLGARLGLSFDRGCWSLHGCEARGAKPTRASNDAAALIDRLPPIRSRRPFRNRCAGKAGHRTGGDGVAEFDARSGSLPRRRRSGGSI